MWVEQAVAQAAHTPAQSDKGPLFALAMVQKLDPTQTTCQARYHAVLMLAGLMFILLHRPAIAAAVG